jgi:hypothetical protein
MSKEAITSVREKIFRTEAGKHFLEQMYLRGE